MPPTSPDQKRYPPPRGGRVGLVDHGGWSIGGPLRVAYVGGITAWHSAIVAVCLPCTIPLGDLSVWIPPSTKFRPCPWTMIRPPSGVMSLAPTGSFRTGSCLVARPEPVSCYGHYTRGVLASLEGSRGSYAPLRASHVALWGELPPQRVLCPPAPSPYWPGGMCACAAYMCRLNL